MQDFFYERIKARDTERFFRDFEYFKSLYPEQVRQAQRCVEEVCDEMEYEGSPIYDEYPDKQEIERVCRGICEKIEANRQMQTSERRRDSMDWDFLGELVSTLFCQEMHCRRCRRNRCRRFF